ncbi:MAG: hypothetical protein IKZ85_03835 [Pseudobutyrivibrio sp.]|nr:hypothetical protein [Pseudobutyrivibrio sp.]
MGNANQDVLVELYTIFNVCGYDETKVTYAYGEYRTSGKTWGLYFCKNERRKKMLDVSKLSDKDLKNLMKAVLSENKKRGTKGKYDACMHEKLIKIGFADQLKKGGA